MSGAVPFVVLFQGRTGSTFFVEALDQHPAVSAGYEWLAAADWDGDDAPRDQLEYVRELLTDVPDPAVQAVGFKTKLRDVLDRPGFARVLAEVGARVIHLKRRNLVKLTVSSFNGERVRARTGDWNLYRSDPALAEPLEIDPAAFRKRLDERAAYERELDAFVAETARPALTLFYSDLLTHADEVLELAFRFLGVEPVAAAGRTLKITSDDLRIVLANFDELRASVAGTPYEEMFDEVLVRSGAA